MNRYFKLVATICVACFYSLSVKADLTVEQSGDVKIDKNLTVSGTTNSTTVSATTVNATTAQTKDLTVTGTFKAASVKLDSYQVPSLSIGGAARSDARLTINGGGASGKKYGYGIYSSLSQATGGAYVAIYGSSAGHGSQLIGVQGVATGNSTRTTSPAIGVYGIAKGNPQGKNYGVYGTLQDGSESGAGVYGSTNSTIQAVPGRYAGYFNGDVKINGCISYINICGSSDARLKTNIKEIKTDALQKVQNLRPVSYTWQQPKDPNAPKFSADVDMQRKHYGLIAQDVQKLFPELVQEDGTGYLTVNYTELIPLLIKAVQDLSSEVEELKKAKK